MMALFKKKSEKKSLVITILLNGALIVALFYLGLTYMDPPEENGIAINFGTEEVGAGDFQSSTPIRTAPSQDNSTEVKEENPAVKQTTEEQDQEEDVVTQEKEEAPVVKKQEDQPQQDRIDAEKADKNQPEETERTTPKEQDNSKPVPQPDQATTDALNSILNGQRQDGTSGQGDGNDGLPGDKGSPDGDPNASSYYGQGKGLDGDGNYRLGGRQALTKKKYVQNCNESGTVVVEIKVNRQGNVIRATPGVRGTTNTSSCLLDPARRAAMETKFNSDANAPSVQTGFIIYEFRLSD